MATPTKVSQSALCVLVGVVGLAAAQTVACSAKISSCDATNPCPEQPGDHGCPAACASYQFCASDKCLPAYVSTRVLPAIDQVNGGGRVDSAVVLMNERQGDLVLQLSGELHLSDADAGSPTTLTGSGYARYTATASWLGSGRRKH